MVNKLEKREGAKSKQVTSLKGQLEKKEGELANANDRLKSVYDLLPKEEDIDNEPIEVLRYVLKQIHKKVEPRME
jgi:hypothetical protein